MTEDPIIQQLHETRKKIAARFNDDLHAICEDARRRQQASGEKAVSLPARPAEPQPARKVG